MLRKNLAAMKIEKSDKIVNPYSGINFVLQEIETCGIRNLIDNHLGKRSDDCEYSYSDVIIALWTIFFCGGDCAEDITEHLGKHLKKIPGLKVPSADTILRCQKELKTEKEIDTNKKGIVNELNKNIVLNRLNIGILKHLHLLKERVGYDFDFDNQLLPTEKYDARRSYKHVDGYFPGIATINGMPVYVENRNGNSNVKYRQEETLEMAYSLLAEAGVKIQRSRMDCGSYGKEIIEVVEKYSKYFYIRAMCCDNLEEIIRNIAQWQEVEINYKQYEVASIEYQPFGIKDKVYRLVIMREFNKNGQVNLFTEDAMKYRSILTNDWANTELEVIKFFNQRGNSEKVFDVMNNDFGWNRMPFSFMNENTVFLILMAICKNVYQYIIEKYSQTLDFLKKNFRLKKFIFRFINVAGKWIRRGRQNILKLYTSKPYELMLSS